MKVRELIARLQEEDPETEVLAIPFRHAHLTVRTLQESGPFDEDGKPRILEVVKVLGKDTSRRGWPAVTVLKVSSHF